MGPEHSSLGPMDYEFNKAGIGILELRKISFFGLTVGLLG